MLQPLIDAIRLQVPDEAIALPGNVSLIPEEMFAAEPSRQRGSIKVDSTDSLVAYLSRHKQPGSAVFASREDGKISAVLDWHYNHESTSPGTDGAWGDHRATMNLRFTEDWKAWTGISGKAISQKAFVEFIEENLDCIQKPTPAEMLTIAMTLEGKKNVTFKNGVRLASGDTQIQWEENTEAKTSGDLKIPTEITLKIPVYLGAEKETTVEIKAYFRYAIEGGRLTFTVKLIGVEKVADLAFAGIVASLGEAFKTSGISAPIYLGSVKETPREILKERIP